MIQNCGSAPSEKSVGTTTENGADPSREMPLYDPVNPDAQRWDLPVASMDAGRRKQVWGYPQNFGKGHTKKFNGTGVEKWQTLKNLFVISDPNIVQERD